jgi:methanethiol S-methyltransferase
VSGVTPGWQTALAIWLSGFAFALVHSALAASGIKQRCYRAGLSPQWYRLLYVIIAVITTALWLWFVRALPNDTLWAVEGPLRWLLHGVQVTGLWVFWLSLRPIDVGAFLGLRPFGGTGEPFIERGIYRYIRHPMYSGIMLVMFAMPAQSVNSLQLFAVITVYFVIGARFEERRMLADHPEYADYRRRVPAFIPNPFRRVSRGQSR